MDLFVLLHSLTKCEVAMLNGNTIRFVFFIKRVMFPDTIMRLCLFFSARVQLVKPVTDVPNTSHREGRLLVFKGYTEREWKTVCDYEYV